jgi:glycosyltransferase involved in cell wall biosynthesis
VNILIIDHYAGSPVLGMEFRPYFLAKEWIRLGHNVTIIAADFSHLRSKQPVVHSDLQYEKIDGISYLWLKTTKYESSGIKRILNILMFTVKLLIYYKKITSIANPEIVIASSTYPLDIYPAYLIAKKNKAKLVFELHDLWPLSPMIIGNFSKYHPFIWLMQRAENFACMNCDCYISLLGNAKEYLRQHGLKNEKFFHIPNGFSNDEMELTDIQIPDEHKELLKKLKSESKIIIGYAGGHAPSNALKSFVTASGYFEDNHNIIFVLVGDGSCKDELIELASVHNHKNIYFLSPISKSQIPVLLSQFDILYAGGVRSVLHSYGSSFNKIIDYMLAEKPIIFAVDEPNSLVEKVGCGIRIEAENEAELVKTIKFLSGLSVEERKSMGEKGRKYAMKELNYTSLAKKFIDAVAQSCTYKPMN